MLSSDSNIIIQNAASNVVEWSIQLQICTANILSKLKGNVQLYMWSGMWTWKAKSDFYWAA